MQNKRKYITIILLLLLLVSGTAIFGWWFHGVLGNNETSYKEIPIAGGGQYTSRIDVSSQSGINLVPIGATNFATTPNCREYVDLEFSIIWVANEDESKTDVLGNLLVNVLNVTVTASNDNDLTATHGGFVGFVVGHNLAAFDGTHGNLDNDEFAITLGVPMIITIRVTIQLPTGTESNYANALHGAQINFDLRLEVEVN
jgi:hypothetical protein